MDSESDQAKLKAQRNTRVTSCEDKLQLNRFRWTSFHRAETIDRVSVSIFARQRNEIGDCWLFWLPPGRTGRRGS
jgi:hypothetical protein